jgi:hypothetical protein
MFLLFLERCPPILRQVRNFMLLDFAPLKYSMKM